MSDPNPNFQLNVTRAMRAQAWRENPLFQFDGEDELRGQVCYDEADAVLSFAATMVLAHSGDWTPDLYEKVANMSFEFMMELRRTIAEGGGDPTPQPSWL